MIEYLIKTQLFFTGVLNHGDYVSLAVYVPKLMRDNEINDILGEYKSFKQGDRDLVHENLCRPIIIGTLPVLKDGIYQFEMGDFNSKSGDFNSYIPEQFVRCENESGLDESGIVSKIFLTKNQNNLFRTGLILRYFLEHMELGELTQVKPDQARIQKEMEFFRKIKQDVA